MQITKGFKIYVRQLYKAFQVTMQQQKVEEELPYIGIKCILKPRG